MSTHQGDQQGRSISRGIAILAALNAEPENGRAHLPIIRTYMIDGVSDAELVASMIDLATFLLVRLEKLAGRDPWDELRYLAEHYGE